MQLGAGIAGSHPHLLHLVSGAASCLSRAQASALLRAHVVLSYVLLVLFC